MLLILLGGGCVVVVVVDDNVDVGGVVVGFYLVHHIWLRFRLCLASLFKYHALCRSHGEFSDACRNKK